MIQFLAGAPELLARYRNAPPAARALIDAAMDARRLGMGAGLPQAFLEAAAPGYLTDAEWDALGEDWLEQALAYTAVPCKGARGPLTRIRPRPARHAARNHGDQPASMAAAAGPLYRLADYLDQHGRAHRSGQIPPAEFWSAAAAHAAPGDQAALGDAAHARGLYRDAAQLHKNAAASGNTRAVFYLGNPPACLRADPRPVHWAAAHAPLDDPSGVAYLLNSLRATGAHEQAAALLASAGRQPTPPSTARAAWPCCWAGCGRRARTSRPPRCWPVTRPPTPPSTARTPWPPCWAPCARRARTSRPPRWPAGPPPTPWTTPGLLEAPQPGEDGAMSNPRYTAEMRERAVKMVMQVRRESGQEKGAVARVAQQLGIGREALRGWVAQAEVDSGARPGTTSDDKQRIKELERENSERPGRDGGAVHGGAADA